MKYTFQRVKASFCPNTSGNGSKHISDYQLIKETLMPFIEKISVPSPVNGGKAVAQLVEALRYKPEGCSFDSRCCHWNFSLT
jgi:hypothetical protein